MVKLIDFKSAVRFTQEEELEGVVLNQIHFQSF